jgi:hypothetical protein
MEETRDSYRFYDPNIFLWLYMNISCAFVKFQKKVEAIRCIINFLS